MILVVKVKAEKEVELRWLQNQVMSDNCNGIKHTGQYPIPGNNDYNATKDYNVIKYYNTSKEYSATIYFTGNFSTMGNNSE